MKQPQQTNEKNQPTPTTRPKASAGGMQTGKVPAYSSMSQLPAHITAHSLRRAQMVQRQQMQGNTAVMRQLAPSLQRQDETETAVPSVIKAGGNYVEVTPGGISIFGPTVHVNAALTEFSGIVRSQSLITDNVIASSYSPGAGNIM